MIVGYDAQNQPQFAPLTAGEEQLLTVLDNARRDPFEGVDYARPGSGPEGQEAAELLVERGFAHWGSVRHCGMAFLWITPKGSAYVADRSPA